ncbi:hypothetical protein ADK57_28055 [Streptomyces sp. MMG1533]|uniref:hypothetical protein n=1 Tax=Streptomyces sp. MMG1533 TaxID=1415546 RepID=UPI0006C5E069|nr:hypothetical protein [Streptomyces sp. MMG1533]KOU61316.1 hypothetical protein ADK57_28055 [Streptomyces sp. MMG1533]
MDDLDAAARQEALRRLDVLVGEWAVEAEFAGLPPSVGHSVFEWTLDGQFLLQRTRAPKPAPDSMAIVAVVPEAGGEYTYHYYDSRGVVRLYSMTFADGVWRLLREAPDFSPLSFRQRFTGQVGDDGNTIHGVWDRSADDSAAWEKDIVFTYRRSE